MKDYIDYIVLNEKTDTREWELVIRVIPNGQSFGWYRYANSKIVVSDSQFDITVDLDDIEESLQSRFGAYHIAKI